MDFSLIVLFKKCTLNRTAEKEVFQSRICSTELNVKTFGYCKILIIRPWCVCVCCFGIRGSIDFCWKKVQNWNQRFFSKQKTISFFQFNKVQVRCKGLPWASCFCLITFRFNKVQVRCKVFHEQVPLITLYGQTFQNEMLLLKKVHY